MIDERILKILACPKCETRPPLKLESDWLVCTKCQFGYRIENGIPNLLPEFAVNPEERKKEMEGSDG